MSSFIRSWFMVYVALLFLTACGGGGGGGATIDSPTARPPSNTLPPPDGAPARPPRGGPPAPIAGQTGLAAIGAASNSLLMTDLVPTSRSAVHANTRGITTCGGSGGGDCSSEPAYSEPSWSIAEIVSIFSDHHWVDQNQNPPWRSSSRGTLRVDAPQYGVQTGIATARTSSWEPDEGRDYTTDYTVYAGWLDQNFFGVKRTRYQGRNIYGTVQGLEDVIAASVGTASGSNPMTGSAEWTGLVVALDRTAPDQAVQGQAALTYDFGDNTLDALFSNLRGARAYNDLSWTDLAVTNGRFSQGGGANSIDGTFYGAEHEEIGGVFERSNLVGAFGGTR